MQRKIHQLQSENKYKIYIIAQIKQKINIKWDSEWQHLQKNKLRTIKEKTVFWKI